MKLNWIFGLGILLAIFNIVNAYDDEEIDVPSKDKTSQFIMTVTSTKTIPKTATKTIPTNSVKETTTTIPTKTIPNTNDLMTDTCITYTYRSANWETWGRLFDDRYTVGVYYTKLPKNVDSAVLKCYLNNSISKERKFNDVICDNDNTCYSSYTNFEEYRTNDRYTSTTCLIYTSKSSDPTPTVSIEPEFICTPVTYISTYTSTSYISRGKAQYIFNGETEYQYKTDVYTESTKVYTKTTCYNQPTDVVYSPRPTPTLDSGYKVTTIDNPFGDGNFMYQIPTRIMTIPGNIKSIDAKCVTNRNEKYTLPGKVATTSTPVKMVTQTSKTTSNGKTSVKTISNGKTSVKTISGAQTTGKTIPGVQTTGKVVSNSPTTKSLSLIRYENGYYDQYGNYYSFYKSIDRVEAYITECDLYTYQESQTPTVQNIPTRTLYTYESVTLPYYYTGWKHHTTLCNYKTNDITSRYFTTTLTLNAIITAECTTISTIGTYTTTTVTITSSLGVPVETAVTSTIEAPVETTVTSTFETPVETTVTSTIEAPVETTEVSTMEAPVETTEVSTIKEPTTIPIPTTKCIPVVITVTEKDVTTITEKETITVTVTKGSTESDKPVDDSKCSSKWAQCGGIGFNGPTCCKSGSTCHKLNEYYSQCI